LSLHGTNRFWAASYDLTLFLDFFETFCEDASRNKLCVSANFMILGATVQKLWVFEVLRWSLGRVGMCWSQWGGVDQSAQKWGKEEKMGRQEEERERHGEENGTRARPAGDQRSGISRPRPTNPRPLVTSWWATSGRWPRLWQPGLGRWPAVGCGPILLPRHCSKFFQFFFSFSLLDGCTVHPFFQASPYTWKCEIFHPHKVWRFYFFWNFIFAKFRLHLDLHIYHLDFCFMGNWDY
jgi:hypothetical protein